MSKIFFTGSRDKLKQDALQRMEQNPSLNPMHAKEAFYRKEKRENAAPYTRQYNWTLDKNAYQSAVYEWMRGQEKYQDWSDADLQNFAAEAMGMSPREVQAKEFWETNRRAWEEAKVDAERDRNTMLGEIEAFKQGINENYVNTVLSRERTYHDANIANQMRQVQQRLASMGRTASPYLLGHLQRRLEAQAADQMQVRRVQLEQEVQRQKEVVLNQMQQVYGNTDRQIIDPATAAAIAKEMGAADAPSRAAAPGGSSNSPSSRYIGPVRTDTAGPRLFDGTPISKGTYASPSGSKLVNATRFYS